MLTGLTLLTQGECRRVKGAGDGEEAEGYESGAGCGG